MKIKTIEEIHKILKQKAIKSASVKVDFNSKMTEKYCELNNVSKKMLEIAFEKLGLSARAYYKILKVARTIADLENKEKIEEKHIAEAIQYRSLDKKYGDKF